MATGFGESSPHALICDAVSDPAQSTHWLTSSDGTPIALHDFGGDGPPLMVVHATGFHAHTYAPLIPGWTQQFHVWGVDLRGHGASQIEPDATFVWDDFATDLLTAIDHVGEPVSVFAHSMGGATTLMSEAARPGAVRKAWVYEPIIFPAEIGPRNSFMAENAARRRPNFPSRAEALERYASRPPLNLLRADALAAYVRWGFVDDDDGTVRLACRPVHEALTFSGARIPATRISAVDIPVIVAKGYTAEGETSAADFATGTADALTNGQLVEYADLGHFGPLEAPARIGADAAAWLLS